MTTTPVQNSSRVARQRGQRIFTASFGLVILLLIQYVLGIAYNLYGTAPTPANKIKVFSSPLLGAHVVVGTLLIVFAIYLVVVAVRGRERVAVVASIAGLACIIGAWASGSAFTQEGTSGYSMAMGLLTAVALLCCTAIMAVLGARRSG